MQTHIETIIDNGSNMNLMDLYSIKGRRFTDEEKTFIKKHITKKKFLVKYAIWKQTRKNGLYIIFIIDHFPIRGRPTAMDHSIEVICTRELSDMEYEECIENWGCSNRVLECYDYKDVDYLIYEDKKYNVDTPQKFINECRKRGYTKQPDLFGSSWEI